MTTTLGAPTGANTPLRVEDLIAKYPDIDEDQVAELLHWFRKEASALDVGSIASEPRLADGYQRFKADHLERFRIGDLRKAAMFVMAAVGFVALMLMLAE